jgi:hypothetical protein
MRESWLHGQEMAREPCPYLRQTQWVGDHAPWLLCASIDKENGRSH